MTNRETWANRRKLSLRTAENSAAERGLGAVSGLEARSMAGSLWHPIYGQDLRFSAKEVSDDPDTQVAQTIALMSRYAREDSVSPEIQAEAQGIRQACGEGAGEHALICKAWETTQGKIQFIRDEATAQAVSEFLPQTYEQGKPIVEILIRPRDMAVMANQKAGDCDDYSMYLASLLLALGIKCCFVTVAGDSRSPDQFTHVYVAAYTQQGQRVAVDASHGKWCGWEAREEMKRPWMRLKEWPVDWAWPEYDGPGFGTIIGIAALIGGICWAFK